MLDAGFFPKVSHRNSNGALVALGISDAFPATSAASSALSTEFKPVTNGNAQPEDVYYKVSLRINQKHPFIEGEYIVLAGHATKIVYDGSYISFTQAGTYVLKVDGWLQDYFYTFDVK